jgi:site-specific DNA recombinase
VSNSTLPASREYLEMPKRKERAAAYVRESDPTLMDSATMESQINLVRQYIKSKGYDFTEDHMYIEAVSAHDTTFLERSVLMEAIRTARRNEYDVLVIPEVRALSRNGQYEVFTIWNMLQKQNVRLESVTQKFEDTYEGEFSLSIQSAVARAERDNMFARLQRGKKDRLELSHAVNGHARPAYGYMFVDTLRETNAKYALDLTVVYIDTSGVEWTAPKVVIFIFSLAKQGQSVKSIAETLNGLGIPPPYRSRKGEAHWQPPTVHRILTNEMYIGRVWANKYKRVKVQGKGGKKISKVVKRPKDEQYLLPEGTALALIDIETFAFIQHQLDYNKLDSQRNSKHPKAGLLRSGYVFCGICGRRMHVVHHNPLKDGRSRFAEYYCRQRSGNGDLRSNHTTSITVSILDKAAYKKILEVMRQPELVRLKVAKLREDNQPVVDVEDVEATIEGIRIKIKKLLDLAASSTDDETYEEIKAKIREQEQEKQKAQSLLYDVEEDDEERAEVEAEIVRFEKWVAEVQPLLLDPNYKPSYEELRLAVHVLGIKAIVYPQSGDYPFRAQVDFTIPEIVSRIKSQTRGCLCTLGI